MIAKHMPKIKVTGNIKRIIECFKPIRYDKITRIDKLKNITLLQDNLFEETMKGDVLVTNTRIHH